MAEQTVGNRAAVEYNTEAAEDSKVHDAAQADLTGGRSQIPATQVLQRVIFPRETDPLDVRPLYLDEPENIHSHVSSRRGVVIPRSTRVSFATYFNAFPASYWKRWSILGEVVLQMYVRGEGRVDLYRSRADGEIIHMEGHAVRSAGEWSTLELRVSLAPFGDGGWIWFDAFTDATEIEITDAAWTTDTALPTASVAVGITTFNRPSDCVDALLTLAEDPAVLDVVKTVFVADQGNNKIADHGKFAEAKQRLGGRLNVIEQGNLGGSGGFTRALLESMEQTACDQVLLIDDDILLEPDSVLRMSRFSAASTQPLITGAQMLSLHKRSHLHTMGETVNLAAFRWQPAPGAFGGHDFGKRTLRNTPWLHRRIDATYNGWWMCMFPREVLQDTGMPLPLFIKWDDAEYSLRAAEYGYPTVTLPGAAIWHVPWAYKDDATDWTVYFHVRNRLISMALHSPHGIGKPVLKQALKDNSRRLFSMQYSAVALEHKAIRDFLEGPEQLFDKLPTALGEIQTIRKQYSDAQFKPSLQDYPNPIMDMRAAQPLLQPPVHPIKIGVRAVRTLIHNMRRPDPSTQERPQLNVPADKGLWFVLGNFDSATVSSPDGTAVAFRKRDPKAFRRLALESVKSYRRLVKQFPRMKRVYREALPELTASESWRKLYDRQT